ncbi:hypothetical protein AVEN_68829-1 [Araneus ventricosus]|uniref:Uncharacterized protein n=1 Tax=Araneus ventricosus TaxID=182803 RepID=A0A4Y2C8B1_ARAVE|nr:hypothetical protein AVEN_68829-1 [Araneus ventricosus]
MLESPFLLKRLCVMFLRTAIIYLFQWLFSFHKKKVPRGHHLLDTQFGLIMDVCGAPFSSPSWKFLNPLPVTPVLLLSNSDCCDAHTRHSDSFVRPERAFISLSNKSILIMNRKNMSC